MRHHMFTALINGLAVLAVAGCGGGGGGGSTAGTSGTASSASLAAASSTSPTASSGVSSTSGTSSTSTSTSSLPAVFSKFTSNVRVSVSGSTVVLETDDLPNHRSCYWPVTSSMYEPYTGSNPNFFQNPGSIQAQTLTFRIPLNPAQASDHQPTSLGPIGISVNGVAIFNQYNGGGQALTSEIDTFDQYEGHPANTTYHYHVEPTYLTQQNGKSALVGFLADGFPVYGPVENGATVTNAMLDSYHGHVGATADYPSGIYHYHVTAEDPYINGGAYYGTPGSISR